MLRNARTFHIVNLGCKVNRVEADSLGAALLAHGLAPVDEEAADLVIVNTCTVTGEAEKKTRKAVRHAIASNSVASIVVTGCAAAISPEVFQAMDPRVRVAGKRELERIVQPAQGEQLVRVGEGFRTRVGIKIQDGCDRSCTYCIVHVARGKAWSRDVGEIIEEAKLHFDAGVKEIVLTGIDIGAYRCGDVGLPQLMDILVEQADAANQRGERPARIRISSIEPVSVTDEFIETLARHEGRVCRHLHLPLQSGSTKVLGEMNRPYTSDEFAGLVGKLRGSVPSISLSTDVIVGFPGETEEDFEATCALVREAKFSRLHVFPYSRREGTPAAERRDQIAPEIKQERAACLRAIGKELAKADFASRAGTTEFALVEGSTCLTESYHELPTPDGADPGSLVPITLG